MPISTGQAVSTPEPEGNFAWQFKLTPSVYQTTHQPNATDLNLRANTQAHAMWIGQYDQAGQFHQIRLG
ncbi:hypothetical protein B472_15540 [Limnohabitans sp. Rim28]|jgi:hypothetical protein|nr:hypothetical protein B472_15540 [Limnohabitans sp. Rim28]